MNAPKHAPGPWTAQGLAIVASDRSFVGRVYPWCADPQDAECAKGNARLIAAAPELLEALELAVQHYNEWASAELPHDLDEERLPWLAPARAAIAKAKGESA